MSGELLRLTESPKFQIRFKNALSAIAGLFRYREVEQFALLAARNPAAQRLRHNLATLDELLEDAADASMFRSTRRKEPLLIASVNIWTVGVTPIF